MHQEALSVTSAASRLVPHGSCGSLATENPADGVIVPSVVATLAVFTIATRWTGEAWPTLAASNVVVPGYAHRGLCFGMPQVDEFQPTSPGPRVSVNPAPQLKTPASPTPVAIVPATYAEPGAWSWKTKVPTLCTALPTMLTFETLYPVVGGVVTAAPE
jgi:hypothetical protein